jgi:uncharacterized integral membrane protein
MVYNILESNYIRYDVIILSILTLIMIIIFIKYNRRVLDRNKYVKKIYTV